VRSSITPVSACNAGLGGCILDHRKKGAAVFERVTTPIRNPLADFDPNGLLID
jgi:hypothetical protein